MESSSSDEFNKKLLSNEIKLEFSFTDQLYSTIHYLYPKSKTETANQSVSSIPVRSNTEKQLQVLNSDSKMGREEPMSNHSSQRETRWGFFKSL